MDIVKISDIQAPEVEVYTGLNENQVKRINEPKPGLFICESERVIQRAIEAGYEEVSFFVSEGRLDAIARWVSDGSKVFTATDEVMRSITGYSLTGGVLAAMKRKRLSDPAELLERSRKVVVLDDVENPTNIGALFRSAAALGADAVVLTSGCADPFYRRAARVSMGTVFQIEWTYADDDLMDILRSKGFYTVALALSDEALSIRDIARERLHRGAIILGNEDHGISGAILEECDVCAMIPMHRGVDSLNVAAASAVALWELF